MNDIQQQLGRIAPMTDNEAVGLARPGTLADLAAGITRRRPGRSTGPSAGGRRPGAARPGSSAGG